MLPKVPHRGLRFHNGAKIIGKSTDKPEKAAGLSAANLLIIIDEASGYADELWEAMEGNLAGDAKIFAISNPTKPVGWFARLWRTKEGKGWKLFTISSEETPNVKSGKRLIPGLAGLAWIKRLREKYGPDPERYRKHRIYKVRVLGEFPDSGEDTIISLANIDAGERRWSPADAKGVHELAHGSLVLGVDPARYGTDDADNPPERGFYAYRAKVLSGDLEAEQIAEETIKAGRRLKRLPQDEAITIVMDGVGEAGGGTKVALRNHPAVRSGEFRLVVSEGFRAARDTKNYTNRRTEIWFGLDEWLKQGGAIEGDAELRAEMLGPKYEFDAQRRLMAEAKPKTKKRMGKSPNRADALTLAASLTQLAVDDHPPVDDDFDDEPLGSFGL